MAQRIADLPQRSNNTLATLKPRHLMFYLRREDGTEIERALKMHLLQLRKKDYPGSYVDSEFVEL